ncbi:MAG: hypothetical protein WAL79_03975, partial [Nitrososphaeraceae archaeon]
MRKCSKVLASHREIRSVGLVYLIYYSIFSPTILLKRAKLTSIQTNYLIGGLNGISDSIDIYRISGIIYLPSKWPQ